MSKKRIKELVLRIAEAKDHYYNKEPIISDNAFDALCDELKTLDPKNKILSAVGAPITRSEWKKAEHKLLLGSLDKVNTPEEFTKWAKDHAPNEKFVVMDKLDGLSLELIYENGKFVSGITRGDGRTGENISVNVVKMEGVVAQLPSNFTGSLRGEIMMKTSIFEKHFSDKSNQRNAASGISKRLDGVGVNYLTVMCYQAVGDLKFETEEEMLLWIEKQGLIIPNFALADNIDKVNKLWKNYQDNFRKALDYCIDGLVVRINDLKKQVDMGFSTLNPKGARAFKFEDEMRETTIIGADWQVGGMGRVVCVAIVEPTMLGGAEVKRASLYNMAYINELQLDIGAKVLIKRANEVIPRVEELVQGTGKILQAPTNCPKCSYVLEIQGEYLICPNAVSCPAQVSGRLMNWVSELNILEFGDTLIEKLVSSGKVNTVADLYTLTVADLASLERMGEKSAQKAYDLLWEGSEITLDIFLGALSIPLIGGSTIRLIMDAGFDTLEKIQQISIAQLENIKGIGGARATSLFNGLVNNKTLIEQLLANGVKIKEKKMSNGKGKLAGKSFVITGTLSRKRDEIAADIEAAGGFVSGSVSKNTSYLLIADPSSQSSKAKKARDLGVKCIGEQDLLDILS